MSCSNRVVLRDSRLRLDDCALSERESNNYKIDDYQHFNPALQYDHLKNDYEDFANCNQMVPTSGMGSTHPELVDVDSKLKIGSEFTMKKVLNQDLRKLGANGNPETERLMQENRLKRGNDFGDGTKRCDTLSEASTLDLQLTPMISCLRDNIQNPNNIVPIWTWGGDSTRDVLYQKAFLENQGMKFINGIPVDSCGFQK